MSYRCPGQWGRKLEANIYECPNCGYQVELFSDEIKVSCPNCGGAVYQEVMPSCIDWCPAAEECVGPEKWQQLQKEKEELSRLKGAAMKPTEILKDEHRTIERLLRILELTAKRLEEGKEVPPEVLEGALEFIKTFADRCHHGKEEELLFPLLEERGLPRAGGPIGVMLQEHESGREFVRAILRGIAGYKEQAEGIEDEIISSIRGYTQLLKQHIQKEDNVLFPMADHLLSQEEQRRLLERFEEMEKKVGAGMHERCKRLIEELEGRLSEAR